MTTKLNPGDRIAYTRAFLRSMGGTREIAQRRGTFIGPYSGLYTDRVSDGTGPLSARLSRVRWDDCDEPTAGLTANICRINAVTFAD